MVFTIAIDARAIKECESLGRSGLSVVASMLNSLDQNCLLIECRKSTFSVESLIRTVNKLADSFTNDGVDYATRNRLKATLKKLWMTGRVKSFRFEESFNNHHYPEGIVDSLANVVDQLIVSDECTHVTSNAVPLMRYSISPFEWIRSKACSEGVSKGRNDCQIDKLLTDSFRTLLSWSDQVHIIDYSLGVNWRDRDGIRNSNYTDAIPHWCSFFRSLRREIQVVIRTLVPRGFESGEDVIKELIADITDEFMKNLGGSEIRVKVEISDKVHSRFLHACGFFIDIDRGIDICYKNGSVRRTSFGFKRDRKLESELG